MTTQKSSAHSRRYNFEVIDSFHASRAAHREPNMEGLDVCGAVCGHVLCELALHQRRRLRFGIRQRLFPGFRPKSRVLRELEVHS